MHRYHQCSRLIRLQSTQGTVSLADVLRPHTMLINVLFVLQRMARRVPQALIIALISPPGRVSIKQPLISVCHNMETQRVQLSYFPIGSTFVSTHGIIASIVLNAETTMTNSDDSAGQVNSFVE